jgi:hypothetical protein
MDRVILVLTGPTAEMLHELAKSRIVTLDDGLAGDRDIVAARRMVRERHLLADVVNALEAPK